MGGTMPACFLPFPGLSRDAKGRVHIMNGVLFIIRHIPQYIFCLLKTRLSVIAADRAKGMDLHLTEKDICPLRDSSADPLTPTRTYCIVLSCKPWLPERVKQIVTTS